MNNDEFFVKLLLVTVAFTALINFIIGFTIGERRAETVFQQEATKRGVAQYNPITSVWEWTAEKKDLEKK